MSTTLEEQTLLLTVRDVSAAVQCSERHVWHLAAIGQFPPPIRLGRAARWSRQTIEEWIAKRQQEVPNARK